MSSIRWQETRRSQCIASPLRHLTLRADELDTPPSAILSWCCSVCLIVCDTIASGSGSLFYAVITRSISFGLRRRPDPPRR